MQKYPEKAPTLALDFLIAFGCCVLAIREQVRAECHLFRILLHFTSKSILMFTMALKHFRPQSWPVTRPLQPLGILSIPRASLPSPQPPMADLSRVYRTGSCHWRTLVHEGTDFPLLIKGMGPSDARNTSSPSQAHR